MSEPDLITESGREDMAIAERIAFLEANLMMPPFYGITQDARAATQAIHDLKLTIGAIRNVIALYRQAKSKGVTDEQLTRGAHQMVSPFECWVLAWRRGGHREWQRVRTAQRKLGL